jgi:hypothetical protein
MQRNSHLIWSYLGHLKKYGLSAIRADWLIEFLQFYIPFENRSLIWRCHCRWRAALFGLWSAPLSREGSWSYHTCCDTGPRFQLRHAEGCWWSILTQIFTGPKFVENRLYLSELKFIWRLLQFSHLFFFSDFQLFRPEHHWRDWSSRNSHLVHQNC